MTISKCFIILLVVAVAAGVHVKDRLKEPRANCRRNLGLTKEFVAHAENNLRALHRYLPCMARQHGAINGDGTIDVWTILTVLKPTVGPRSIRPVVEWCIKDVYRGRKPHSHEVDKLFTRFIICTRHHVSQQTFDSIGLLEPPKY